MGICQSNSLREEDRKQARTATFVRYATMSDITNLRKMITNDKMDPNAQDRFGMNALHWAAYAGKVVCVEELLKAGASPTATDSNGRNALHHTCRKDHEEVVRYLINTVHLDINFRSENKDTPLHKAVRGKSVKVVEVLLKLGADPTLRNDQNRNPLEELEASAPTELDEANIADLVASARMSAHLEEPEFKPPGYMALTLKRRSPSLGGRMSVELTRIRSFASRRSTGSEYTEQALETPTRAEPGSWASRAVAPTADNLPELPTTLFRKKNLRYAGKRVIMALRVKKGLPDDEKRQMIRLMLQKYLAAVHTPEPVNPDDQPEQ